MLHLSTEAPGRNELGKQVASKRRGLVHGHAYHGIPSLGPKLIDRLRRLKRRPRCRRHSPCATCWPLRIRATHPRQVRDGLQGRLSGSICDALHELRLYCGPCGADEQPPCRQPSQEPHTKGPSRPLSWPSSPCPLLAVAPPCLLFGRRFTSCSGSRALRLPSQSFPPAFHSGLSVMKCRRAAPISASRV